MDIWLPLRVQVEGEEVKACRTYGCANRAPRNSTICLPCMKRGFQQDGMLIIDGVGPPQPGSFTIRSGSAVGGKSTGGDITITTGNAPGSGLAGDIILTTVTSAHEQLVGRLQGGKLNSRP